MMSSSGDISTCVVCGVSGMGLKLSKNKVCTSCAQKVDHSKKDGEQDNAISRSSSEFRFKAPSDRNDLTINSAATTAKSLFVFGGRDNGRQSSIEKDGASDNTSRIDALSDSLGRVAISNDDDDDDDDKLFQDPPPREDMLPMPHANVGICGVFKIYFPCCGKIICTGCVFAARVEMDNGNMKQWCSLCRVPYPRSNNDRMKRIKKRMKLNDALAFLDLGMQYREGEMGLPQDTNKSLELWTKAAELGSIDGHQALSNLYYANGGECTGWKQDMKKAIHHAELAAIGGHEAARHNVGAYEEHSIGNMKRATKHYLLQQGRDMSKL